MARRNTVLLIGLALSTVFLLVALRDVEMQALGDALARSRLEYSIPLLAALAMFFWFKAWRWRMLLTPVTHQSIWRVLPATVIGYAGNILLPLYLGELARVEVLKRQYGVSRSAVLATLVLERMFDFLTILCLIGVILATAAEAPEYLRDAGKIFATLFAVLLLAATLLVLYPESSIGLVQRWGRILPEGLRMKLLAQLQMLVTGLGALRQPALVLGIGFASIIQWLLMGVCVYCGMLALNLAVPLSAGFLVLALSVAGMTLPSSPGFIGTIQLAFELGLEPYGVSASNAFAASIFFHVLVNGAILVVGFVFLRQVGVHVTELSAQSRPSASSDGD